MEVTDYEWEDDQATIYLSNHGNGLAKNLGLATLVHVDTGTHRRYVIKSNALKRQDKPGTWSNVIQPGEEDIEFLGKSKIGEYRRGHGFISISFSAFVRRMKEHENSEKIKYQHVVQGSEMSGNGTFDTFYPGTRSINPQNFCHDHSLENPSGYKMNLKDTTFIPALYPSRPRKFIRTIYIKTFGILNWLIPKYQVYPRPMDASGKTRVQRVGIRFWMKNIFVKVRNITKTD